MTPELENIRSDLTLRQTAPHRFSTKLKGINPGAYTLKISRIKGEKVVDLKTKGLVVPENIVPKPIEHSSRGNNIALLKNIAEITGGMYNPGKEDIKFEEVETNKTKDFAGYLIPLAMILFIFDIAVRKFNRQMV